MPSGFFHFLDRCFLLSGCFYFYLLKITKNPPNAAHAGNAVEMGSVICLQH